MQTHVYEEFRGGLCPAAIDKRNDQMSIRKLMVPTALMSMSLIAVPAAVADDDEEIPFADAEVFFELNNTDGDLGIHASIDGEPWKKLEIEDPRGRTILNLKVSKTLRHQGLTELFFESAEPTFDQLNPRKFFRRFPEGEYEVEGKTLDGKELESDAVVTHLMPAPPTISVNGVELPDGCDEGSVTLIGAGAGVIVSWEAITHSHPELGRTNEPIEVVNYQVVLEGDEQDLTVNLPPDVTELELPAGFSNPGDEFKVEVLVREESSNQTATESCFELE